MRLIFFGTPAFALPALAAVAARHDVVRVVTAPARPRGRGQHALPTPVGAEAERLGLEISTPERLDAAAVQELLALRPAAAAVVAYGKMLPAALFESVPCLNVHPSLLPRHRGAAPIPWTIWSGDAEWGVSIMRIVQELDAGPVHLREARPVTAGATAGELEVQAALLGARMLAEALDLLAAGRLPERPQEGEPTYARRLVKEDERLDLGQPARDLARQVLALSPRPGARVRVEPDGLELRLLRARAAEGDLPRGALATDRLSLLIGTGQGVLAVDELQPAGGRVQTAADLLRGRPGILQGSAS